MGIKCFLTLTIHVAACSAAHFCIQLLRLRYEAVAPYVKPSSDLAETYL
jgi:hypothetical protein